MFCRTFILDIFWVIPLDIFTRLLPTAIISLEVLLAVLLNTPLDIFLKVLLAVRMDVLLDVSLWLSPWTFSWTFSWIELHSFVLLDVSTVLNEDPEGRLG